MELGLLEDLQASFRREANDLLADLGDALLLLEQDPGNADLVNRVFRSMHTLKGSGAAVGFRRLARFVHHVEEVFNRIRNRQLQTTPALVDATLKACDCCVLLLELGTSADDTPLPLETEVLAAIRPFLPEMETTDAVKHSAKPAASVITRFKIGFCPYREIFFSGTDPASLLLELTDLGEVEIVCNTDALLASKEFDPEKCYVSWTVVVETSQPEQAVRAVFQFVEDDCELSIEALPALLGALDPQPSPAPLAGGPLLVPPRTAAASASPGRPAEPSAAAPTAAQSIRVDSVKLDALMRLAGELLVARGALPAFADRVERSDAAPKAIAKEMRDAGSKVARLTNDLQATVMSIRMLPARHAFQRFPRLVRDLARSLDKEIELQLSGEETELDKTVVESIGEPLTHIIRNAGDHGIESRADRVRKGKSPIGHIHLSAYTRGSTAIIEIKDDGKGLDAAKLKRRAVEKGLYTEAEVAAMDDGAAFKIIMAPGFSTMDTITDLSGRGVGMDAVRSSVEALRGVVHIESKLGEGTSFRIVLPASLLVSKGILVEVAEQQVVVPMETIHNMVKVPRAAVHNVRGERMAHVRGAVMPLISLASALSMNEPFGELQEEVAIAVIDAASGVYGLIVDRFVGEVEIVVKPLSGALADVPEYQGVAITGDGRTVLVVNTDKLFSLAA